MKYIIVFGSPIDGFNYRGPFDTLQLAHDYIDATDSDETAWPVELTPPFEEYKEPSNKCICGHLWTQHQQNVHRTWVCTQCNCRNSVGPSENPN